MKLNKLLYIYRPSENLQKIVSKKLQKKRKEYHWELLLCQTSYYNHKRYEELQSNRVQ